jgi:hypothetical protein
MDNLFFNRMITPEADKPAGGGQDSRQGIVKKKQETIFEISKNVSEPAKNDLDNSPFSFDPTRTIPKPLRQHPILKKRSSIPLYVRIYEKNFRQLGQ